MGYGSSREGQPQGRTLLGYATPLTRPSTGSIFLFSISLLYSPIVLSRTPYSVVLCGYIVCLGAYLIFDTV